MWEWTCLLVFFAKLRIRTWNFETFLWEVLWSRSQALFQGFTFHLRWFEEYFMNRLIWITLPLTDRKRNSHVFWYRDCRQATFALNHFPNGTPILMAGAFRLFVTTFFTEDSFDKVVPGRNWYTWKPCIHVPCSLRLFNISIFDGMFEIRIRRNLLCVLS